MIDLYADETKVVIPANKGAVTEYGIPWAAKDELVGEDARIVTETSQGQRG